MSSLYLTSIRNQGASFMQSLEDKLKSFENTEDLKNLARYWVDSCILLVDPAILACRDVPLLQPYGLFISIEFSRRFQTDAIKVSEIILNKDCTFNCKVQTIANLLVEFSQPPVRF